MTWGERLEEMGLAVASTDIRLDTALFYIKGRKYEVPRERVRLEQHYGLLCAKVADVLEAAK